MKSTSTDGTTTSAGKVVLVNGAVYRGEIWTADGLTHVRQLDGHVRAFGPKAVFSIDFGQVAA